MSSGLTPYTASSMTPTLSWAFTGAPVASVTVSAKVPACRGRAAVASGAMATVSCREAAGTFRRFSAR